MKAAVFILLAFSLCGCGSSGGTQEGGLPNEVEAEQVAHSVIKAQSIDPENVEFADEGSKFAAMPDSSWVFMGLARMPNEMGLKSPKNYNVVIKWKGGRWDSKDSWNIEDCKITDPAE